MRARHASEQQIDSRNPIQDSPNLPPANVKETVNSPQMSQTPELAQTPKLRKASDSSIGGEYKGCLKKININYVKAIVSFANSHIAIPYLKTLLQSENVRFTDFTNFMNPEKVQINGICAFEALITIGKTDDAITAACKRMLKALSVVFIKYFSVNWIIHSKLTNKLAYLKHRFKILRRIQNPEVLGSKGTKADD